MHIMILSYMYTHVHVCIDIKTVVGIDTTSMNTKPHSHNNMITTSKLGSVRILLKTEFEKMNVDEFSGPS